MFTRHPAFKTVASRTIALLLGASIVVTLNAHNRAISAEEAPDLSVCSPAQDAREALPVDVQKYLELTDTCRNWGKSYTSSDVIENVNNHASFTTTRCYTMQLRYNKLMKKYAGKNDMTNIVSTCYVSF